MSANKKYWKSGEQLKDDSPIMNKLEQNEFTEEIPTDEFLGDKESLESSKTSRRDFLKYVGFSTAAASLASCEGPVMKSVPYVNQPERIVPGMANYYATSIADGHDFASILVKTREARPIRVDNNYEDKTTGANARVHASVLSLYDKNRLQAPLIKGEESSWEKLDKEVTQKLKNTSGEIAILTPTLASPATLKMIDEFSSKMGNVRHVVYDAVSEDGALNAFQALFGTRALPSYHFEDAETIVSVGADFLGDWQGGHHDMGYARSRVPKNGKMSRHIQFEANLTMSGSKADKRVLAKPSEQKKILSALYNYVSGGSSSSDLDAKLDDVVVKAARQLKKAGSKAIVTTGLPSQEAQLLAFKINESLGSEIFDTDNPRYIRQGNTKAVQRLVKDMKSGRVSGLMISGVNPAYSLPNGKEFKKAFKNLDFSLAFSMKEDETAKLCDYIATTPHFLESWGDVRFSKKLYSLMQPTIRPIFDTRQMQESMMTWMGKGGSYMTFIRKAWEPVLDNQSWNETLHDGVFTASGAPSFKPEGDTSGTQMSSSASSAMTNLMKGTSSKNDFELCLYTKVSLGDGKQANNPWLQEMPDPITRTTWDNYITISKKDADKMELENHHVSNGALNGDYVSLKVGDVELKKVPVIVQPGQAPGSIGLALGYGQKAGIQEEMQTGVNAFPVYKDFSSVQPATIKKVDGEHEFACTQLQNTMAGRDIIKETDLETFITEEKEEWNAVPKVSYDHNETSVRSGKVDLWQSFDHSVGPHFNLSIDLNACTGCGACVIACHAENNVPVVGKEEVRKFRDMHWLRIDRYYSSEEDFDKEKESQENRGAFDTYEDVETAEYTNPQVAFQPVMCQHCDHAPCETVCPVAAITHGRQGQNQMIYNRCVGTRYCANNCPYKVRRFNWFLYNENEEFDYHMNNDLGRMVLNPDVTVRSRGVMEKCSMCIQLTQEVILDAKKEGRPVEDDEFYTACSLACDKGAMEFGDVNNKNDAINDYVEDDRKYRLLESLGTEPNVLYQTIVRNTEEV
jgi:molybdopterin-containing oxidoreductase family iron-sulfur binding subunit